MKGHVISIAFLLVIWVLSIYWAMVVSVSWGLRKSLDVGLIRPGLMVWHLSWDAPFGMSKPVEVHFFPHSETSEEADEQVPKWLWVEGSEREVTIGIHIVFLMIGEWLFAVWRRRRANGASESGS